MEDPGRGNIPINKGMQRDITILLINSWEKAYQLAFKDTSRYMYTVDYLHLKTEALKPKKKKTNENS